MNTGLLRMIAAAMAVAACARAEKTLLDFSNAETTSCIAPSDAAVRIEGGFLVVRTSHNKEWPGVTLRCPGGFWDCTGFRQVASDVTNLDSQPLTLYLRVDNPGADGTRHCVTKSITIAPGQSAALAVSFYATPWALDAPLDLVGMRGYPQPAQIKTNQINQLIFFVAKPKQDHVFKITSPRAEGAVKLLNSDTFLPFIDRFGQFRHADWPGKIHSEADLVARRQQEEAELDAMAAIPDRNQWGGWSAGPKLEPTGFFRAAKVGDNWWLVDPDGRLFWSHGVDCVGADSSTPVSEREPYFESLPAKDSECKLFWNRSDWAPHGFYKGKGPYDTFNFAGANLQRKYAGNWYLAHAEISHRRLAAWGMNTIGNWSETGIYRLRKTPYTATLGVWGARPIEGSEGYWGKFPDPFDPSFAESIRSAVEREKNHAVGDPRCIGFFVDNELAWGDDLSLAAAALASGPDQPAKKVFVAWLKSKYRGIESLNAAWAVSHASWDALSASQAVPDKEKARADLHAFYMIIAEKYFETIRTHLKAAAPEQLYFGCRFAWANESAVRAAAKYCDVLSFNMYEYSVADFRLPEGLDKPVIIGEFHFGALDRGMFHTGLKQTADQDDRAQKYTEYVTGALKNPCIVGTHWFQYRDQATTGRGDGENYQIGLVDICDTPYAETVQAVRQIGRTMYRRRFENANLH